MATPMGLSCTLPPSCFTFFLPLLVSFVSRLGLVRLDSALLGPQQSLSLSLYLYFSSSFARLSTTPPVIGLSIAREPRPSPSLFHGSLFPPLHPPAGPRGYQPLVFTSGQLGGDFDKTTSKLKPTRPPASSSRKSLSNSRARAHARNRDIGSGHIVRRNRTERAGRGGERVEGSPLDLLSHTGKEEAREEGPSTSRRTRTGGFVKTKARSFVESRSKGKECGERRGRGRRGTSAVGSEGSERKRKRASSKEEEQGRRTPVRFSVSFVPFRSFRCLVINLSLREKK